PGETPLPTRHLPYAPQAVVPHAPQAVVPHAPQAVVPHSRKEGPMTTVSVRYIVNDVGEAITFYRDQLGFAVEMHPPPTFAILARGDLRLLLSAPSTQGGGGQILADGRRPQPGGWNRISLEVSDLAAEVERLGAAGMRFRGEIIYGIGGNQILLEDPSGNPIELFEPKAPQDA